MSNKKIICIIFLCLILFSTVTFVSADDDKNYTINHAIINLIVDNNGLLHVNETYDYAFNGEFNGVYRDIPLKSGESINNIHVTADGAYPVLKQSDENGEKHLKIFLYADEGHSKKIKDVNVKIHISYDMQNVVTVFKDTGSLHYQLWGKNWDVGVGSVDVNVKLPNKNNNSYFINPQEYIKSSNLNGNMLSAETGEIPNGEICELVVLMPVDDFANSPYAKHTNQNGKENIIKNVQDSVNARNFWNSIFLILGVFPVLLPFISIFIYLRYGREPDVDYDGIYERELPSSDSPAVVNAIVDNKNDIGLANMKGFEASLLNLIDQKIIQLDSQEDDKTEMKNIILTFTGRQNSLSQSNQIIYDILRNFAVDDKLNLSKLNNELSYSYNAEWFMDKYSLWQSEVQSEIDEGIESYFNNKGSSLINGIGYLGIIYGIIIAAFGLMSSLNGGIYALIGGIFSVIFSFVLTRLHEDIFGHWTKKGRTFYLKWSNFKKFLKDNSLIKQHPPESIVIWKKYLIYGTALGVAENVYKSMKLNAPELMDYDDDIFIYHNIAGYYLMSSVFHTMDTTMNSSDFTDFGDFGGGSGGGGGGAF